MIMKYNAFSKHQFKGVYWDYTSEQDETGQMVRNYSPVADVKFTLMPKDDGFEVYADEELRTLAEIRDITGKNYVYVNTVTGTPKVVRIDSSVPVKDALGNVVGYQHTVTPTFSH